MGFQVIYLGPYIDDAAAYELFVAHLKRVNFNPI